MIHFTLTASRLVQRRSQNPFFPTVPKIRLFPLTVPGETGDSSGDKTDSGVKGSNGDADGGDDDDADDDGEEDEEDDGDLGDLEAMLDNLDQFVVEPAPQGAVVKCRITRDRKGMDRGEKVAFILI